MDVIDLRIAQALGPTLIGTIFALMLALSLLTPLQGMLTRFTGSMV